MKKTVICLIMAAVCLLAAGCGTGEKEISKLYVGHTTLNRTFAEYLVDLSTGEVWSYNFGDSGQWQRDKKAENEGYTLAATLSDEDIEAFSHAAKKIGKWKEDYFALVLDGHQWEVELTYSDGSKKTVTGSNAYPDDWSDLGETFETLTDIDILRYEYMTEY